MSLASFAFALCIFWLILHALQRFLRFRKEDVILSSSRFSFRRHGRVQNWHVTIRFLQARVETSTWNEIHDRLLVGLKRKGGSWSRTWLERFYNVGFASGIVGMIVAFGLLVWTAWALSTPFSIHRISHVPNAAPRLEKRDGDFKPTIPQEFAAESPIALILPGVTVPLNHIPFIFGALFISQIFHEFGHALAGALYGVPILSSGASLILCIPSAFVSFSTATLDTLHSSAKSRIVAAGPFHNLLFWCFWVFMGYLGGKTSGIFLPVLGYKDISLLGRVVLNVDTDSPLAGYVTPGTIITKLNDRPMASSATDVEPWSSFLRSPQNEAMDFGWCVEANDLSHSPKECCLPDEMTVTSSSCFVANTDWIRLGCLDPVPILTSTDEGTRCTSKDDCQIGFVCVRPAEKEKFVRLTVRESKRERDKVVLWTGPRGEIWDQVIVGTWFPRFVVLPLALPLWIRIFWEYMLAVNLSLFLFNLIPLNGLDGSHFLRSVFAALEKSHREAVYAPEALERGEVAEILNPRDRSKVGYLETVISWAAGCLFALNVVLAALALRRD